MSTKKYRDAELILKLYELRRDETMRKARHWLATEFNPQSPEEFTSQATGEHNAYFRMVTSYWEMACSLVNHGAIDDDMFNDANAEHVFFFAKIQPFLEQRRAELGNPKYLRSLEKVVMRIPNIDERLEKTRSLQRTMAANKA